MHDLCFCVPHASALAMCLYMYQQSALTVNLDFRNIEMEFLLSKRQKILTKHRHLGRNAIANIVLSIKEKVPSLFALLHRWLVGLHALFALAGDGCIVWLLCAQN